MMRSTTATPAPRTMPQRRWRWGSPRHAIAMTTALSPDSRMLIHMIFSRATQNVVWPTSLQPLVTMASHVAGSVICAIEPTGRPFCSACARARRLDGPPPMPNQSTGETYALASAPKRHAPRQQPQPVVSPHDFVAGKKLRDFLLRRLVSIGAVHRILTERLCVERAYRSGSRLRGVGRT